MIIVRYVATIVSACQYVAFNSQRNVINALSMVRIFSELTPCCMVTHDLSVGQRRDKLTTLLVPQRILSYRFFLWCPGLLNRMLGHEPFSDEIVWYTLLMVTGRRKIDNYGQTCSIIR